MGNEKTQTRNREGKLVKNTIILAIGTFLPKMASFVTMPILTGYLTKAEYGYFDLITVLVSLLLPAVTLQIQTAAFRFLIDVRKERDRINSIVTNIFAFIIPTSIIALLILWICLPQTTGLVKIFILFYFMVDIVVNATRQVARGLHRNLDYSISACISAIGKVLFALVFVWWGPIPELRGLTGATLSLGLASFLSWIVLTLRIKLWRYLDFHLISKKELKALLAYSWPMVPNSMSMWVMRLSDRLVVTAVMGVTANAVYSVANKIPSLLNLAQNAFSMAWQENASIVSKDEDAPKYYSSMFATMFDLMAGALGLLVCLTPVLFMIFVRGNYEDAYVQMPILFLAQFFFTMATFLGGIYVAYKHTKSVGVTTVIAAVVNLVVDWGLIYFIGLYAASISTLVSYMLLMIYRMVDVRKIVRLDYNMKHIMIVIAILTIECVLCYLRFWVTDIVNVIFGSVTFLYLNKGLVTAIIKKLRKKMAKR